jgi:hypothetical protein
LGDIELSTGKFSFAIIGTFMIGVIVGLIFYYIFSKTRNDNLQSMESIENRLN